MTDDQLLNDLKQAATPPPPKDFRPGVIYAGMMPSEITTPAIPPAETQEEWEEAVKAMGIVLPPGMTLALVEAQYSYNAAAWQRDPKDRREKDTAYTAPNHLWRYKFKVVPKSLRSDEDVAVLMKEVKRATRGRPLAPYDDKTTMVINLADFQVGKTDVLGGTKETLARSEAALQDVLARVKVLRPKEILLVDNGDSTEGFESAPNANRTNDLHITEQIRVWRRIFWRWIEALAKVTEDLKVIGVPSNHCRVRTGKNALGDTLDDWGIEVIAQLADMTEVNPEAYGHVQFTIPRHHEEHVAITLVGGKVIAFAHGHQVGNPNSVAEWAKKQGRGEIGLADIVVVGHFHHLRVQAYGHHQWLFMCPTFDPGSSWYSPSSGEESGPGILTFLVNSKGWQDLEVIWA